MTGKRGPERRVGWPAGLGGVAPTEEPGTAAGRVGWVALLPYPSRSALPNSIALPNLSAGDLASALATARSTPSGTVSRISRSGRGVSVNRRASTTCAVGPENGGSPAIISHSTQPSE